MGSTRLPPSSCRMTTGDLVVWSSPRLCTRTLIMAFGSLAAGRCSRPGPSRLRAAARRVWTDFRPLPKRVTEPEGGGSPATDERQRQQRPLRGAPPPAPPRTLRGRGENCRGAGRRVDRAGSSRPPLPRPLPPARGGRGELQHPRGRHCCGGLRSRQRRSRRSWGRGRPPSRGTSEKAAGGEGPRRAATGNGPLVPALALPPPLEPRPKRPTLRRMSTPSPTHFVGEGGRGLRARVRAPGGPQLPPAAERSSSTRSVSSQGNSCSERPLSCTSGCRPKCPYAAVGL